MTETSERKGTGQTERKVFGNAYTFVYYDARHDLNYQRRFMMKAILVISLLLGTLVVWYPVNASAQVEPMGPLQKKLEHGDSDSTEPNYLLATDRMIAYGEYCAGRSLTPVGALLIVFGLIDAVAGIVILAQIPSIDESEDASYSRVGGINLGLGFVLATVGTMLTVSGSKRKRKFSQFVNFGRFDVIPKGNQPYELEPLVETGF